MADSASSSFLPRYWILCGGLLLAMGYLPMLQAPFDFTDDGNLVYAAPAGTGGVEYLDRWWDRVVANVEHLGPFRPVLWAHWELAANLFQDSPFIWRAAKLLWCGFAGAMLLWLLKELRIPPVAALLAAAAAIWNPYRNEIWTSLTLAEGVAMPYALLALLAARKASGSSKLSLWDAIALLCWFLTLGCKNTFVALLPAMLILRASPDQLTLRAGLLQARWVLGIYFLPLLLPFGHFVYFKLNWHAGQYETPGPSLAQLGRILSWLKGTAGLDFLGVALLLLIGLVLRGGRGEWRNLFTEYRAAWLASAMLSGAGIAVYLPMGMMAARYTMPAIWGVDILVAILLSSLLPRALTWPVRVCWTAIGIGLFAVMAANMGRQERLIARHRMLWDALEHVRQMAPPQAKIEWISGGTSATSLNVEEGIHFAWHLLHRGRADLQIGLVDANGTPIKRVELEPLTGAAEYRITMDPAEPLLPWRADYHFARAYRFGRKLYQCELQVRVPQTTPSFDPFTLQVLRQGFENPDASLLQKLSESRGKSDPLLGATAELKQP